MTLDDRAIVIYNARCVLRQRIIGYVHVCQLFVGSNTILRFFWSEVRWRVVLHKTLRFGSDFFRLDNYLTDSWSQRLQWAIGVGVPTAKIDCPLFVQSPDHQLFLFNSHGSDLVLRSLHVSISMRTCQTIEEDLGGMKRREQLSRLH